MRWATSFQVHLRAELNRSWIKLINQESRQPNTAVVVEQTKMAPSQLTGRAAPTLKHRDKIKNIQRVGFHKLSIISLMETPEITKDQKTWIPRCQSWSQRIETSHIRKSLIRNWPRSSEITIINSWVRLETTKKIGRKTMTLWCSKRLIKLWKIWRVARWICQWIEAASR